MRISAGETSGRLPRGQTGRIVVGKKALGTTTRALKEEGKKALVAYLMAGFPDEETFIELLRAAASAGCDVIEVGIPFSDPIADGPLIQSASKQALDSGVTLKGVLDLVGPIALELGAPLVIMSYLNPVLRLGIEPFARKASASGFVGVILPDVPVEESGNIRGFLGRAGISYVDLLAPTSSRERIERVAGAADGFLYLVSVTGVTGVRPELSRDLGDFIARVRSVTSLPLYVGFGISSAEQAGEVAKLCDGVIVGSAIVAEARSSPSKSAVVENVQAFLEKVRAAVDDSSSVSRG